MHSPAVRDANGVTDARELLDAVARQLRDALLSVVWQQWKQLGASAAGANAAGANAEVANAAGANAAGASRSAATSASTRGEPMPSEPSRLTLVDPEALLLASLDLLAREQRLRDVITDWVATNADVLSVQRVRNLLPNGGTAYDDARDTHVAWLAAVARDLGKDPRWKPLAGTHPHAIAARTMRTVRARTIEPSALMLRMRLAFGVGVKADLLSFLLANAGDAFTIRDIAEAVGYTVASVRRAAGDLAASRFILLERGESARYRIALHAWRPLLGWGDEVAVGWGAWRARFAAIDAILQWADASQGHPLSAYAFAVRCRTFLSEHPVLTASPSIARPAADDPVDAWGQYFVQAVRALIAAMVRDTDAVERAGAADASLPG